MYEPFIKTEALAEESVPDRMDYGLRLLHNGLVRGAGAKGVIGMNPEGLILAELRKALMVWGLLFLLPLFFGLMLILAIGRARETEGTYLVRTAESGGASKHPDTVAVRADEKGEIGVPV